MWSARQRDLYLTTHNTRQETFISPAGLEFAISRKQAAADPASDRAATGIGTDNIRSDKTKKGWLINSSNLSPGQQN